MLGLKHSMEEQALKGAKVLLSRFRVPLLLSVYFAFRVGLFPIRGRGLPRLGEVSIAPGVMRKSEGGIIGSSSPFIRGCMEFRRQTVLV